jgi:predicted AAA+ superfamily ATPase
MYERAHKRLLLSRIKDESRKFIQVLYGPRQVGKTTLVRQLLDELTFPWHYASADQIISNRNSWISEQWESARIKIRLGKAREGLLVLDEIQKLENWSESVKKEWDSDAFLGIPLKVILLGSSRLLIQKGLTESLAGRFETLYMTHWSYAEMQEAFQFDLENYICFGGYPGAAGFIGDEERWKQYIRDSLIETSISRDVLMLTRVDKPALLRNLFELGCRYSSQILSFTKIMGQLQDAGNTTTLAHYLHLLDAAGLLGGIEKFSPSEIRQRASSPKFQVHNNALLSSESAYSREKIRSDPRIWGRWVESAVGAYLLNHSRSGRYKLFYWRERNKEVDFVLTRNEITIGIEVKSSFGASTGGTEAFSNRFSPKRVILVGRNGIPLDTFLKTDPAELF